MFCTHCGRQNPDDANFCYFCGTTMNKDTPSPAETIILNEEPVAQELTATVPVKEERIEGTPVNKDNKKGLAITGLVFSIVGLCISVLCCIYFGSMILGVACCAAGIVLCAISMKSQAAATIAVTGLIIGIVGVIIGILMLLFFLSMLSLEGMPFSVFDQFLEEFMYY